MKRTMKSIISLLLVVVLMAQLFPLSSFAVDIEEPEDETEETITTTEEPTKNADAFVVGEVNELREESVKHFRMSDGSYVLVEYDTPVHFQSGEGKWKDIDNTLQEEGEQYVSRNGDVTKSFSADLSDGNLLSMQYKQYAIEMSLVTSDRNEVAEDATEGQTEDTSLETDATENENVLLDEENVILDTDENDKDEVQENMKSESGSIDESESELVAQESQSLMQYKKVQKDSVKASVENPVEQQRTSENSTMGEMITPEKTRSKVRYEKAFQNADLVYENRGYNLKESIIINSKQEEYKYSFGLALSGLYPEVQENGAIFLNNESGETIFELPAPYMIDSNQEYSDAAKYTLEETPDGWIISITADPVWLNADSRAFPVTLDPTLYLRSSTNIQATYICSGRPSYNGGYADIYVGYAAAAAYNNCQICARVNSLPTIPGNCTPVAAQLAFFHTSFFTSASLGGSAPNSGTLTVEAHKTIGNITTGTVTWNSLYTNGQGIDSTVLDYQRLNYSTWISDEYNYWDITPVAMNWFSNNAVNCAIMLTAPNAQSEQRIANLWTESGPYFVVSYRNTVGLENYYTYQEASAGRAGSIYVSDFTQQLTAVHTDLTYPSEITPFTLSHVYNSALCYWQFTGYSGDSSPIHSCNFSNMKLGCGWKLSAMQTVVPLTINGTNYLVFNDEDGTEHYFQQTGTNTYQDEDGLGLTISKSTSGSNTTYTMTDYGVENTWVFYNGYLISQTDSVGNAIYYAYNNAYNAGGTTWKPSAGSSAVNRLKQIVSVPNGMAASVICTFYYSGDTLVSITDYANRTIDFTYATENSKYVLKTICDVDQADAYYLYDYDTGRISTLYDAEAEYGLDITKRWVLGRWSTNRITEYTAPSVSGTRTNGNSFHAYRNSTQLTSYRFYGPDHVSETTDDVVGYYALDYSGRTICAYDTNYDQTILTGATAAAYTKNESTSKANNRLTNASALGYHVANILKDKSANSSSYWAASSSSCLVLTDNAKAHTGNGVLKCSLAASASDTDIAYLRQTVQLTGNKVYIFSGYINTCDITTFPNANTGSYLAIYNGSNLVAKSDIISYNTASISPNNNELVDVIDEGWEKVSVAVTVPTTGNYYLSFEQQGAKGSSYCDDLQLEEHENNAEAAKTASSTNYVSFGGFDHLTSTGTLFNWSGDSFSVSPTGNTLLNDYCAGTTGSISAQRQLTQTITFNKPAKGRTFVLSGWGKANSVGSAEKEPTGTKPYYGLIAEITYSGDSETEKHYVSFNSDYTDWQFASGVVVPKKSDKTISTISIICAYNYNANDAYFDNISFLCEPVETYVYDTDGTLKSTEDGNAKVQCTYISNSNRLQSYTTPSEVTHNFTYTSNKLVQTEAFSTLTKTFSYTGQGNVSQEKVTATGTSKYLQSNRGYTGHFCTSSTDANGVTTQRGYYDTSSRLLHHLTKPGISQQNYTYYSSSNRLYQTYITGKAAVTYTYGNGMLSQIDRKAFPQTNSTNNPFNQKYTLHYADLFGNLSSITVAGSENEGSFSAEKKLIQHSYESGVNNGRRHLTTYSNGDTETFGYDKFDRTTSVAHNTGNGTNMTSHYEYSSEGELVKQYSTNPQGNSTETYTYSYDSLGRLIHSREQDVDGFVQSTDHFYDTSNRVKEVNWRYNSGATASQDFTYSPANDALTSVGMSLDAVTKNYILRTNIEYTPLLQVQRKTMCTGTSNTERFCKAFAYKTLDGNRTSSLVEYMNYRMPGTSGALIRGYKYEYSNGKFYKVYHTENDGDPASTADQIYSYDALGQLTSVNENAYVTDNVTVACQYQYEYDTAGNIRKMTITPSGGSATVKTLSYGNSYWKDLLTRVQVGSTAENITYESAASGFISGNPISYYNGRHYDFTWKNGRELATAAVGSKNVTYTYDMAGVRSSKTVNSTTYNYDTLGGLVTRQTWTTSSGVDRAIYFVYDENDQPYIMVYDNGTSVSRYYYLTNAQGDVVALMAYTGAIKALYRYDPWGAVTVYNPDGTENTSSSFIGNRNPLRYRGYFYDNETGLYYLQSRYYDPAIGRFINADTFATTDADGFLSCNMFAYCENDPVNRRDPSGDFSFTLAATMVGGVFGGISQIVSNKICGKPLLEGVLAAVVGGATYNFVTVMTGGNTAVASYLSAGVEATVNEMLSYRKKAFSSENLVQSLITVGKKTLTNGSVNLIAGKIGERKVFVNYKSWFQPKKIASCFAGNFARKVQKQTAIQSAAVIAQRTAFSLVGVTA